MSPTRSVFRALVFSLAAMVLVVLGIGQLLAKQWKVETTRTLKGEPQRVAAVVGDLGTWSRWAAIDVNLGPQTARQVHGVAGSAEQRIEWSGPMGKAVLAITSLTGNALEYTIGFQLENAPPPGTGRVAWQPDAGGCRVHWTDEGVYDNVILRWFGWFGALQEKVKQIHGSSLEALQQELEPAAAIGK